MMKGSRFVLTIDQHRLLAIDPAKRGDRDRCRATIQGNARFRIPIVECLNFFNRARDGIAAAGPCSG